MAFFALPDNTKLYYEVVGQGQPLLFVHGCSCTHRDFSEYVQEFKNEYMCISLDWRGHGASDAPDTGNTVEQIAKDLKDFIEGLNLENVILFAHSYGGFMTYEYVKQFGTKHLAKIIINDEAPKIINDDEWKLGSDGYTPESIEKFLAMASDNIFLYLFEFYKLFDKDLEKVPPHLGAEIFAARKNNHAVTQISLLISFVNSKRDYRGILSKIDVPFAYVQPEHTLYQAGTAQWVADHVQNGKAILLKDCHHLNMFENIHVRSQEVLDFIRQK